MFTCHIQTFRFFYSPFMTEGLHRFYGGNDLHFLTFSCYRRRPLFRNNAYCDLFLKILDRVRRRYGSWCWGMSSCRNMFIYW